MEQLTNQFTTTNYRNPKRQRLYLKDMDTPEEWVRDLKSLVPETFYYLNDCIESRTGGDGAILEPNEYGQMRYGKGVAPAGDLMSSLPPEMRALNMMCYIGHEGTYTPAHREMCASLGHNVMVEASRDGNTQKAGSSLWFMTETKEREVVSEYFLSMLGHDIEVEKHFAQINAWKKAPFNVWVVEQRLGDLILIPPLAPHQVWNRGTRTMKAAWNRTTVDTLELALHEALPRARLVCRDEQYKNKAIVYYTLIKYYSMLQRDTIEPKMWKYGRIKQLLEDFKRLFALFTEILVSEMFAGALPTERDVEMLPFDSNVTCSYCRCNIFNRFLTCPSCVEGEVDTYDICMECFAMGRSCACISNLSWVEQWEWSALTQNYETWRQMLVQCDGFFDIQKSPQPLEVARKRYGRKPVAHICQEQLELRPWRDITKTLPSPELSEEEPDVDDSGRIKKKKGGRGKHMKHINGKTHACHVCFHQEWNWKLAFCTTCNLAYCYGVLWRAFDLMPQEVMEDRDWSCPRCLHICSCGKCRKNSDQNPYSPKGTLLGHDTKKVADFRSVESLVDFSKTNLTWLRGENDDNPQESARMKKLKERAEADKAREDVIDENYLDNGSQDFNYTHHGDVENRNLLDIDPQLLNLDMLSRSAGRSLNGLHTSHSPTANGANPEHLESVTADQSDNWIDDSNFMVDFDSYIRPSGKYPPKLTAPVVPTVAQESAPSSRPLPVVQTRMMGIGYYQQETDGADKILYDAPATDETIGEAVEAAAPTPAALSLSDILPQEGPKKRKAAAVEDDTEFFLSKKQRKVLELRNKIVSTTDSDIDVEDLSNLELKRHPGRGVPKPQTYTDMGEEAMPFTEDDIVVVSERKKKPQQDSIDDLELASRAMMNLNHTHGAVKERPEEKTVNTRDSRTDFQSAASHVKKERKSAWLARKEVEAAGEVFPSELPQRTRRRRSSNTKELSKSSPTVDISSGSEENNARQGMMLEDSDNRLAAKLAASERSSGGDTEYRASTENSNNQVPRLRIPAKGVNHTGKRRGRPPKSHFSEATSLAEPINLEATSGDRIEKSSNPKSNISSTTQSFGVDKNKQIPKRRGRPPRSSLQSPTGSTLVAGSTPSSRTKPERPLKESSTKPAMTSKSNGRRQMLSLQEKLTMKGKTFRIVAGKMDNRTKGSLSPEMLPKTSYLANGSKIRDIPLAVESPGSEHEFMRLVSPDDEEDQSFARTSPEPFERIDDNSQISVSRDRSFLEDYAESDDEMEPVTTGPTVIRKDRISTSASPEPSILNTKGRTVIRKDEMFPLLERAPYVESAGHPAQRSVFKNGHNEDLSSPAVKRPTVVRLMSPDDEESSQYSSSESEETLPSKHFQAQGRTSSRGRVRGGPTGMVARRGRGRPSLKST